MIALILLKLSGQQLMDTLMAASSQGTTIGYTMDPVKKQARGLVLIITATLIEPSCSGQISLIRMGELIVLKKLAKT